MESNTYAQRAIAGLLVVLWMSPAVLAGAIIYVDPQAPCDNDGSDWPDAYICLQNALESALPGDEIRVAQGAYQPDQRTFVLLSGDNRYIKSSRDVDESFVLPEGVVIKGGYAGYDHPRPDTRDVKAYRSILTGDLRANDVYLEDMTFEGLYGFVTDATLTDNSRTVVTASGVTESTVLDGFTITAGRAIGGAGASDPAVGVLYPEPIFDPRKDGAGALIDSASATFIQCTFYRNTTRSQNQGASGGAGAACLNASPTFQDCLFSENIAFADGPETYSFGGGLLCSGSTPKLIGCTFTGNVTAGVGELNAGAGVACIAGDPELTGCAFIGNRAIVSDGGAMFNTRQSNPTLTDCYFERNSALFGGAFYSHNKSHCSLMNCIFWANEAFDALGEDETVDDDPNDTGGSRPSRGGTVDSGSRIVYGYGGAVSSHSAGGTDMTHCRFLGNTATGDGGAVSAGGGTMVNCIFSGNAARNGGAVNISGSIAVTNCTFTANYASNKGNAYDCGSGNEVEFSNCILWEDHPVGNYTSRSEIQFTHSNVRSGGTTRGNLNADPRFQDPAGPDGLPGTLDDNLRLSVGSLCIDTGSNSAVPESVTTDLAGQPRIVNAKVDMGAYEFDGPYNYYVDAIQGDDALEGYSPHHAFATIQRGIEAAEEGYTVVVLPGLYTEEINFDGKAITVAGAEGGAILGAPDGYGVSFYSAERSTSVLKNLAIQNCDVGIFLAGASPTIQNITLANNEFGIAAYAGANPDISNCILWHNTDGDLFGCTARYSCIESRTESEGEGNIRQDPLFADAEGGDYHLLAERGRFVPAYGLWTFDIKTSPCVDAGDPFLDLGGELMPNGGRLNMGAFGGTPEASLSEWPLIADLNHDGIVDQSDLDILNEQWLETLPGTDGIPTGVNPLQPNPARWDIEGQPREVQGGTDWSDYSVEMRAGEVVSPNGPVEYFFECDQSAFNSDWQTERTYTVLVGRSGQDLRFRVRARDQSGNLTDWSDWAVTIPAATTRR